MNRHPGAGVRVAARARHLMAGLVGVVLVLAPVATAATAHADTGLGGSTDFQPGATFPFQAGKAGRVETGMFVQNIGSGPAEVRLNSNAPTGITIKALRATSVTIMPTKTASFRFAVQTTSSLAAGTYKVIVSVGQTNVPIPTAGGTAYAPAISGTFVVKVVGASGTVKVNAVNRDDKKAIAGKLTLAYLDGSHGAVLLHTVTDTSFTRTVVPGTYRAQFEIPGLTRKSADFTIAAGENRNVTLTVQGVQFLVAAAKPVADGGKITSADLSASVRNDIRPIQGQVQFNVSIRHDGRVVDQVKFAELPQLSVGTTSQQTSYRPAGGFTAGEWTFQFTVSAPTFDVGANTRPAFTVRASAQSAALPITLAVLAALAVAGCLWWFLVAARRRKRRT